MFTPAPAPLLATPVADLHLHTVPAGDTLGEEKVGNGSDSEIRGDASGSEQEEEEEEEEV